MLMKTVSKVTHGEAEVIAIAAGAAWPLAAWGPDREEPEGAHCARKQIQKPETQKRSVPVCQMLDKLTACMPVYTRLSHGAAARPRRSGCRSRTSIRSTK